MFFVGKLGIAYLISASRQEKLYATSTMMPQKKAILSRKIFMKRCRQIRDGGYAKQLLIVDLPLGKAAADGIGIGIAVT